MCQLSFIMAFTCVSRYKNHSGQTEITDYDKERIDAYSDMKLKSTEIGKRVGCPASTIRSYLKKRHSHDCQTLSRSGCSSTISDHSFHILKCYIRCYRKQKYIIIQSGTREVNQFLSFHYGTPVHY